MNNVWSDILYAIINMLIRLLISDEVKFYRTKILRSSLTLVRQSLSDQIQNFCLTILFRLFQTLLGSSLSDETLFDRSFVIRSNIVHPIKVFDVQSNLVFQTWDVRRFKSSDQKCPIIHCDVSHHFHIKTIHLRCCNLSATSISIKVLFCLHQYLKIEVIFV